MILTTEQKTIVESGGNVALTLDGIPCVVLREDVFATVRNVLGDELNHSDLRAMLVRAFETGDWNDPAMDIYDDYDKHI
jgi:hypothetical protein